MDTEMKNDRDNRGKINC